MVTHWHVFGDVDGYVDDVGTVARQKRCLQERWTIWYAATAGFHQSPSGATTAPSASGCAGKNGFAVTQVMYEEFFTKILRFVAN